MEETPEEETPAEEAVEAEETAEVEEQQTEEAETTSENTISNEEYEALLSQYSDAAGISGLYDAYGWGNAGLMVVSKDDKLGLVTYDNEIVVPIEYDAGCSMVNDEGQSFFGNENGYYVFDKDGKELFHTERTIKSVNDGIVFAMDGSDYDATYAYYKLDGTVLYESPEDIDDRGAVGFNEGYAFMTYDRIDKDGNLMDLVELADMSDNPINKPENLEGPNIGRSFILEIPIGPANGGYYMNRGLRASEDAIGIYTLTKTDISRRYRFDVSSIFNQENLSFETSDAFWDFKVFYDNGMKFFNYGTTICPYIQNGDKTSYYLIDVTKLKEQEWDSDIHPNSVDFDYTVITDEALLAKADFIGISNEKYWLIGQDDKWGYIDHEGNTVNMYDDASEFYNGKALIIEDGKAYLIDESFNKLKELGAADGVYCMGEIFVISNQGADILVSFEE